MAYVGKTAAVVPATPDFIQFMYSSDGYNWRNVSTYYPPFGATNTSSIVTNDAIHGTCRCRIPPGTIKEHKAVREAVGLFDVSHMGEAYLRGPGREAPSAR